jgi:hypothetical protein
VGSGFLKLRDFKKIVDENPWLKEIELRTTARYF